MQLNKEQIEAVNARDGAWCVMATAGAGKSTVICERVRALFKEGVIPDDLLVVTFTKEAASNLEKRLGLKIPKNQKGGFRTFHSFCLNLVRREAKFLPYGLSSEPFPDGPVLSKLLLTAMKENGIKRKQFDEVKAFISRWKRQRILPREVEQHDDQADNAFILAYEKYEQQLRDGGMLDFDGMVVEAVNILEQSPEVRDRWQFKWVMCDEANDTDTLQFRLLQLVSQKYGNIFVVGDYNQCQPTGTLVDIAIPQGLNTHGHRKRSKIETRAIETLTEEDKVVSWNRLQGMPLKLGRNIKIASRDYSGPIIVIKSNNKTTRVTPEHWLFATINGAQRDFHYIVYLMWREDLGFRVGQCRLAAYKNNHKGIGGFTSRCYEENADKAWILHVCATKEDARAWEMIEASKFGLPTCVFIAQNHHLLHKEWIRRIYSQVPVEHGYDCLEAHGFSFEHPLFDEKNRPSQRYFKIQARNLIAGLMNLPTTVECTSAPIQDISTEHYSGKVFSLDVEKEHTYIADGIPVGNCIYAFRGSQPENLLNFREWFPGAKTITLPENYRSTGAIVAYGKKKSPIKNDLTENIRTSNPLGIPIEYRMFAGPVEEAESTLSEAERDPGGSAILARTNNQIGIYESLALQHGIKFHLLGKSGLWNKSEIKTLVNLATFCVNGKSPEKYSETLVYPHRGRIRSLPADTALQQLIQVSNLESLYSSEDFADDQNFAIANLRTVTDIAKRFSTLGAFLNHARKAAHASRKSKNAVTFGTIHSAKGLEFDNVFVIGVQERKLPHERGELAEEARVFYVSISRPAKRLRISFAGTPSQFIVDDLTPEIRTELQKHASQVERIQRQTELFTI